MIPSTQICTQKSCFRTTYKKKVLGWPSQNPKLKPFEHLWRDLKMVLHQHLPSDLTEIKRIQWLKISKCKAGVCIGSKRCFHWYGLKGRNYCSRVIFLCLFSNKSVNHSTSLDFLTILNAAWKDSNWLLVANGYNIKRVNNLRGSKYF